MNHLFVPYPLALLAKEKGFNERCLGWYQSDKCPYNKYESTNSHLKELLMRPEHCTAPLYQQIIDWLREEHNIFIHVEPEHDYEKLKYYRVQLVVSGRWLKVNEEFKTNYESLNKAIEEALKLI